MLAREARMGRRRTFGAPYEDAGATADASADGRWATSEDDARAGEEDAVSEGSDGGVERGDAKGARASEDADDARAVVVSGVREDEDVTDSFGVLIPGTTTFGTARESATSVARRFARRSAALAWRTRLEAPVDRTNDVVDVRARMYAETTSKYINASFYESRIQPMTRFPDGRVNATPLRVAHWIFAEEYVDREAFDEARSDEEENAGESGAKAPALAADPARAASDDAAASTSSMCGWCFGSVTKEDLERASRSEEEAQDDGLKGSRSATKFDVKTARKELEDMEDEIQRLELSALQKFYDMERAANSLRERFTVPMLKNHPRAIEIQSDIKRMDTELKRMIFNRDALKVNAQKLQDKIAAHDAMNPPKPIVVDRGKKAPRKRIVDPFEALSGGKCGAYVLLFLTLAPLHLWHHYEWIQTIRVLKPKLKENGEQTKTFITYFYNPLLVPGARRLRLPASNAEIMALLLAVQSLIGFKLWALAQPESEQDKHLSTYHYMILNTFVRVAHPCCEATIRAVRRTKRRARERAAKKLWMMEPIESVRVGANLESYKVFQVDTDNDASANADASANVDTSATANVDASVNVKGDAATAREQARAYVRVRRSRRQSRRKRNVTDDGEGESASDADEKSAPDAAEKPASGATEKPASEAAEKPASGATEKPASEAAEKPASGATESDPVKAEQVSGSVAEELQVDPEPMRSDTDDTDSFDESFAESEISSIGDEVLEIASTEDFTEFKRKGAALSDRAYKQALKLRLLHEVRSEEKGGRFTARKFSEHDNLSSRETEDFSEFISASLSGSHGAPGNPTDEAYAKLRREYVLKARAERKAEEQAKNPTKKSIFDVSDILSSLLTSGQGLQGQSTQRVENVAEVDDAVAMEKSRLNVDQADTVSQAVLRLSAKHKKQAGRGYWPNGANLRSIDQSKIARAVDEEEVYA